MTFLVKIERRERVEKEERERGQKEERERGQRESRERHIHIERERGEREERDAQSLQGMSLQFHFQFKNALISKGLSQTDRQRRLRVHFIPWECKLIWLSVTE